MYFRENRKKMHLWLTRSSSEQYKEKGLCHKIHIDFFREHNEIWRKGHIQIRLTTTIYQIWNHNWLLQKSEVDRSFACNWPSRMRVWRLKIVCCLLTPKRELRWPISKWNLEQPLFGKTKLKKLIIYTYLL